MAFEIIKMILIAEKDHLCWISSIKCSIKFKSSTLRFEKSPLAPTKAGCSTLLDLIKKAFGEGRKYPVNTKYGMEIFIDSSLLERPIDPNHWDEWDSNNKFNYQLILPASKKELLYQTMQQDIERYFDLSLTRVKKKVRGYELVALTDKEIPKSKNKKSFDAYNDGNTETVDTLFFINQPLERLTTLLNFWLHNSFPFNSLISEEKRIDINIRKTSVDPLNIDALNRDLNKINLQLRETQIETSVLEVTEKK